MAELKRYTSFEALKLDEKPGNTDLCENTIIAEFEAFLKRLQNEYSNKKKIKKENGKKVLLRIPNYPINKVSDLLPHHWTPLT